MSWLHSIFFYKPKDFQPLADHSLQSHLPLPARHEGRLIDAYDGPETLIASESKKKTCTFLCFELVETPHQIVQDDTDKLSGWWNPILFIDLDKQCCCSHEVEPDHRSSQSPDRVNWFVPVNLQWTTRYRSTMNRGLQGED